MGGFTRICPGCGRLVEERFHYLMVFDSLDCPYCRRRYRMSDGKVIPSYSDELAAKNRKPARTVEAIDFDAEKAAKLAKD
jgi:hypothetical protein